MDCAVEVSCVITKEGPRPLAMGRLPIQVEGLVQQMKFRTSCDRCGCEVETITLLEVADDN